MKTLVVDRKELFPDIVPEGFLPIEHDCLLNFIRKGFWAEREEADKRGEWKHLIVYTAIVDKGKRKIFSYERPNCREESMPGMWSIGVGGHIEEIDNVNGMFLRNALEREVREEVNLTNFEFEFLGYVNDEKGRGVYHLGILFLILIDRAVLTISPSLGKGGMRSFEEVRKIFENNPVEKWSRIYFDYLEEYFAIL